MAFGFMFMHNPCKSLLPRQSSFTAGQVKHNTATQKRERAWERKRELFDSVEQHYLKCNHKVKVVNCMRDAAMRWEGVSDSFSQKKQLCGSASNAASLLLICMIHTRTHTPVCIYQFMQLTWQLICTHTYTHTHTRKHITHTPRSSLALPHIKNAFAYFKYFLLAL